MRIFLVCALLVLGCAPHDRAIAQDAVGMILELVGREDADFRSLGLEGIRHGAKSEDATRRFAALLADRMPERQVELLRALADRGDPAAIPAVTALLNASRDPAVRTAAIGVLGATGGGAEVAVLGKSLAATDPERAAAKRALIMLRGDDALQPMIEVAKSGEPAVRPLAIDILAERRARAAVPLCATAAIDADAAVRRAAMRALGKLGGPDEVPAMVQGFLKAAPGAERNDGEKALIAVCTENPGKAQAAESFLAVFKAAGDADRESLLSPLGRIGGKGALAIVDELLADPAKRDFGIRVITRWPDATVADRLFELLAAAQTPAERDTILAALIRIAPVPENKLNDKQKIELVQKILPLCQKDEERAKLVERVNAIRTVEAFRFVLPFLDDPKLSEPACKSVVELAHHQKLRDAHKDDFTKALDKVIATTKNPELVERATRYKEGKTWERK
jgi:HEAT repeat protein